MTRRNLSAGSRLIEGFGLNIFTQETLDRINNATLEVLWHTGVQVYSELALEIYQGGGCTVDKENHKVYIPPYVVEDCINSAPFSVLLAARDPKYDVVLEGTRVSFCNFSKGVTVVDPYRGEIRDSTKQDQANVAILVDSDPQCRGVEWISPGSTN